MRALDLFCCGGGASEGLSRAGFEVTGVDLADVSAHYPFTFVRGDATALDVSFVASFDLVWASPPCQRFTNGARQHGTSADHPDLIGPTRELLTAAGVPYVIENVPGAHRAMRRDLMLCGKMFGLDVARHRIFEVEGFAVTQPHHPWPHRGRVVTVAGNPGGTSRRDGGSRHGSADTWREVMGIDWLPARLVKEAVPPVYAEHIARAFVDRTAPSLL